MALNLADPVVDAPAELSVRKLKVYQLLVAWRSVNSMADAQDRIPSRERKDYHTHSAKSRPESDLGNGNFVNLLLLAILKT